MTHEEPWLLPPIDSRNLTRYEENRQHCLAHYILQDEALVVADDFTTRARELQEGTGMPPGDVDFMAAKVSKTWYLPLVHTFGDCRHTAERMSARIFKIMYVMNRPRTKYQS